MEGSDLSASLNFRINDLSMIEAKNSNMSSLLNKYAIRSNNSGRKYSSDKVGKMVKVIQEIYPDDIDILIVDDVIYNILGLQVILSQFSNFHTDQAPNGQIAVEKVIKKLSQPGTQENPAYRFIFMDINMPVMDGL